MFFLYKVKRVRNCHLKFFNFLAQKCASVVKLDITRRFGRRIPGSNPGRGTDFIFLIFQVKLLFKEKYFII